MSLKIVKHYNLIKASKYFETLTVVLKSVFRPNRNIIAGVQVLRLNYRAYAA